MYLFLTIMVFFAASIASTPVHSQANCYNTGNGPIMSCFEGNRSVTVRKPFRYKDGNYYTYNTRDGGYCFKNEFGNTRCMQNWLVKDLNCYTIDSGQMQCE